MELVNASLPVVKMVAMQTMSQLKLCDVVLEEIVISFLDNAEPAMKVAALDALSALRATSKKVRLAC